MLKDMTALNKKRFVVYGVIFGIFAAITAAGLALNISGHGVAGKMRQELQPYVNKYNNLSSVKRINNTKDSSMIAKINESGILVTYKKNTLTYKIVFDYKTEINGQKYLLVTYNRSEQGAEEIVKNMIEAVSVSKGNIEGAVFSEFDYSSFLNTKFTDGLELTEKQTQIVAKINLDVNLLAKLGSGNTSTTTEEFQITYDNTNRFEDYAAYVLPENFSVDTNDHQIGTENNTCIAKFNVISSYTALNASEFANLLAENKSSSADQQEINGNLWYRVVYSGTQGGTVSYYSTDANGVILGLEYEALYANTECDEYLNQITSSITLLNTNTVE